MEPPLHREWQISRVYSVLERGEPALYHAKRNLEICQEHEIGDFDLAFAYEAMARAHKVLGNTAEVNYFKDLAFEAAELIQNQRIKNICFKI